MSLLTLAGSFTTTARSQAAIEEEGGENEHKRERKAEQKNQEGECEYSPAPWPTPKLIPQYGTGVSPLLLKIPVSRELLYMRSDYFRRKIIGSDQCVELHITESGPIEAVTFVQYVQNPEIRPLKQLRPDTQLWSAFGRTCRCARACSTRSSTTASACDGYTVRSLDKTGFDRSICVGSLYVVVHSVAS